MFSVEVSEVVDVSDAGDIVAVDSMTTGTFVSRAMGGLSTVVDPSVVCETEEGSATGTSVAEESVELSTSGALVATGSCVGGLASDTSTGGGVLSSASTLIGKAIDDINENKTKIVKMVSLLLCFIAKSPRRCNQKD